MEFKIKNFIFLIIILTVFLIAKPVLAAKIYLNSQLTDIKVGQLVGVDVLIDASKEINTIESELFFPSDKLELRLINDGNSLINLWVNRPELRFDKKNNRGLIYFAGIIPGGYQGQEGLLFKIIFFVKQSGNINLGFNQGRVLLHDGLGTLDETQKISWQFFSAEPIVGESFPPSPELMIDKKPPEEFTPTITKDDNLKQGQWFLVFQTQDKDSGIDYYEVCEGSKRCRRAESPYFLRNQNLDEQIIVKAYDKKGNQRLAILPPVNSQSWFKKYQIFVILIIIIILIGFSFLWLRAKRKK